MKVSINPTSVQGIFYSFFFFLVLFFFLKIFSWEFKVLKCLVKVIHLNSSKPMEEGVCSFFQNVTREVYGENLSLPFSNEDVVSLMKFHLTFPILLECALPRFFKQRTFSHCLEAFSALLGTGECSLDQTKGEGMTSVRMIKTQSLAPINSLTLVEKWASPHLPSLTPLTPLIRITVSEAPLKPLHIPFSNSDDALCCNVGGEDSSLLIPAKNWTRPYCCTSGWRSDFGSSISEEHHHPHSPFVFWRVLNLLVGPVTALWNLQGSRWRLTQLSMGEVLNYQH